MEIVSQSTVTDSNSPKTLTVSCPAGKRVVGGGAVNSSPPVGAALPISAPVADGYWLDGDGARRGGAAVVAHGACDLRPCSGRRGPVVPWTTWKSGEPGDPG